MSSSDLIKRGEGPRTAILPEVDVDLLSISGHKIGAPKGVGAMFIRRGIQIDSMFHGGSQDRGRRPGTENVAAAVVLKEGKDASVVALQQWVKDHLRSSRAPERIEFEPELPYNETGKLLRRKVRAKLVGEE